MQSMQNIVSDHEQYLDALRDFNDWLISAKEELQRWSDLSGDSVSIQSKLSKLQVRYLSGSILGKKLFVDTGQFMFIPSSPCCLLSADVFKEALWTQYKIMYIYHVTVF